MMTQQKPNAETETDKQEDTQKMLTLRHTEWLWLHNNNHKNLSVNLDHDQQEYWLTDWVRLNIPPQHFIGHIGDGFYGSNEPTNGVKALKKHTQN